MPLKRGGNPALGTVMGKGGLAVRGSTAEHCGWHRCRWNEDQEGCSRALTAGSATEHFSPIPKPLPSVRSPSLCVQAPSPWPQSAGGSGTVQELRGLPKWHRSCAPESHPAIRRPVAGKCSRCSRNSFRSAEQLLDDTSVGVGEAEVSPLEAKREAAMIDA